ncbi:flotillin family protein [Microbacterium sp. B35-04]|uniref:SPFH domain-containing protein n=1 Tax=unclassified Microbacterium TaxID=2609290 RepID=UPI0013D89D31|nr:MULTISPECIES: SPFH domain-containing protein [unclassified Microbacterium]KAF2412663.1 flotillin family protein [Microbacterium sp. B35-04]KAF2417157.1 flotillin family protein [Microbacterium sp. B35-30]
MDLFGLIGIAAAVGVVLVVALIGFILFRAWYQVPKADEAIVIVGKKARDSTEGEANKMTVISGRGAFVNKLTQRSDKVSLRSRQIKFEPTAQTINGVTIDLTGVALVKIGSTPDQVRRAAERFASQDDAIVVFTTEQLEGALRGVVAKLTVEQVMQDRQKLSDEIAQGISGDLLAQGLVLDSFAIQGITDKNNYISALGAKEVQRVKREADVAEIDATREVKKRQLAADEANLIEQTALDKNTAAAKSEVGRANAQAEQAENLARAEAEQGVLLQEANNTQARLDAEVKKVADADKYRQQTLADAEAYQQQIAADAEAYKREKNAEADRKVAQERSDADAYAVKAQAEAREASASAEAAAVRMKAEAEAAAVRVQAEAEAEAIRLRGNAVAEAVAAEAAALRENQDAILAKEIIGQLPQLMAEFAKGYEKVGSITLIGGDSAASHLAREQSTSLTATFESVKAATGLDLGAVMQGRAFGRGVAEGTATHVTTTAVDPEPVVG